VARSGNTAMQVLALGVLGAAGWQLASMGALGQSAQKAVRQFRPAGAIGNVKVGQVSTPTPNGWTDSQTPDSPGRAPAGAGQVATNIIRTNLVDLGGVPVVFDPGQNTMTQDPREANPANAYGPGDVFFAVGGEPWAYQGGTTFISQASGAQWSLTHFET
jgi:hypothetical protein